MDALHTLRARRTHKQFTGEPVAREALETLLELATWAPCHRMTEPWRFHVVAAERIPALAAAVGGALAGEVPAALAAKRPALADRLPRLGALIGVSRRPAEDPRVDREDYAATSCAVHNILLGATALGLGSFWSTGRVFDLAEVRGFLGVPDGHDLVAAVWLGHPAGPATSARRPWGELTTWV